jgi:hypothetical protein
MQYNCQKNTHFFGLLPPIAKREQASSALTGSCSRQCLSFRAPRFGENLRKVSLRGPRPAHWGQGAVAISWIISRERHDWVCFSPLCGPVYCHNSFSQRHLRSLWPKLALFCIKSSKASQPWKAQRHRVLPLHDSLLTFTFLLLPLKIGFVFAPAAPGHALIILSHKDTYARFFPNWLCFFKLTTNAHE